MEGRPAALAATVIVLEEGADGGDARVLLMRRHRGASFMAGAWVFPGGRVDPGDGDAAGLSAEEAWLCLDGPAGLDPEGARALFGAALRELFEEAGLLLGPGVMGGPEWEGLRREVLAGSRPFAEVARGLGATQGGASLLPWARWVTPEAEPKRFDTFFFLARAPRGQVADHGPGELVELVWLRPRDALARNAAGELPLAPPTWCVLKELAALGGAVSVLEAAPARSLRPVMPRLEIGEEILLLLPGDPGHPEPDAPSPAGVGRLVMTAPGVWRPC